jgi:hypothetical protein
MDRFMSKSTVLATFKLEPSFWEAFRLWAIGRGSNATEVVRFLMSECLAGRIDVPRGNAPAQPVIGIDQRIDEKLAPLLLEMADLRGSVKALEMLQPTLQGILEALESRSEEGTDTSGDKNKPLTGHPGRGKMVDSVLLGELRRSLDELKPKR